MMAHVEVLIDFIAESARFFPDLAMPLHLLAGCPRRMMCLPPSCPAMENLTKLRRERAQGGETGCRGAILCLKSVA